ncbi:MAG: hypothetical protein A2W28_07810 [Gammaproteobacteria bacterium RBG_16_51_14]|nr:MAG: hypothetical protein A2W28_07810 [Gammaproteobacteria bacterium RBG_16_51_14]
MYVRNTLIINYIEYIYDVFLYIINVNMKPYRKLFNNSFQRAIIPDSNSFYKRFYEIFVGSDPRIAELFEKTFMNLQREMLKQSMTYMMSFSATLEPSDEMKELAEMHGRGKLNIPANLYEIWLESMIKTVEEFDPKFDENIEIAWRVMMAPGVAYMQSFCDKNKNAADETT